jgi:hypothetical protein
VGDVGALCRPTWEITSSSHRHSTSGSADAKDEKGDKEEKDGKEAEEPIDPEPGHEDRAGANLDHTPAGEQPEPAK